MVFNILDDMKTRTMELDTVYKHVLGTACQTKQQELVHEIFHYMLKNGATFISSALQNTIRQAYKLGEHEFGLDLLRQVGNRCVDPTQEYKNVLFYLHKKALYQNIPSVFESMNDAGCVRDGASFTTAALAAIQLGKRDLLFEILDDMIKEVEETELTTVFFPKVAIFAVKTKQFTLVREFFDYMRKNNVDCSASYSSTTRSINPFKGENYNLYLQLLQQMNEQGMNTKAEYKQLLLSLHKEGLFTDVLRAFDALRKTGAHNDESYGVALSAAVELEERDVVFKVLDSLKEDFVDLSNVKTHVFKRMFRTAMKTNQDKLVLELVGYLCQADVSSTSHYTTAIWTAFRLKQYDLVLKILEKLKECEVDTSSEYFRVLRSFHKAGLLEHFLLVFLVIRDCGYSLTLGHYRTAFIEAVKLKKDETMLDICAKVNKNEVNSKEVYSYALYVARKAKQQDLVDKLTRERRNHDLLTTTKPQDRQIVGVKPAILQHYLDKMQNEVVAHSLALRVADKASDRHKIVPEILDHLVQIAVNPSVVYLRMLEDAEKSKQRDLVLAIVDHMTENNVRPTVGGYEIILRSSARGSDLEMALKTRVSMRQRGLAMTDTSAHSLIQCAAKLDQWKVVVDLITEMQSEGFKPSLKVYTVALNECADQHCWRAAADMYAVMPAELRRELRGKSLHSVIQGHFDKGIYLRASDFINKREAEFLLEKLKNAHDKQEIDKPEELELSVDSFKDEVSTSDMGFKTYLESFFKRYR